MDCNYWFNSSQKQNNGEIGKQSEPHRQYEEEEEKRRKKKKKREKEINRFELKIRVVRKKVFWYYRVSTRPSRAVLNIGCQSLC